MNRFLYRLSLFLFSCVILLASGCGTKVTAVSGKVLFEGKTGGDLRVLFQPVSTGTEKIVPEPAWGMTDSSGHYVLQQASSKKKGVTPGDYAVYISWVDPNFNPNVVAEGAKQGLCPYKIPPKALLGQIIFTVPETGNCEADFEFTEEDFLEKVESE